MLALTGPCSLIAPCSINPPHRGSSSRNATPAISQNILTAKFHFKESQCNDSSCEGLQPDLHCAWNSHVSTWGESRRRVHKDVPILFPLIPEWSQILASLVTPQSLCRRHWPEGKISETSLQWPMEDTGQEKMQETSIATSEQGAVKLLYCTDTIERSLWQ